MTGTAEEVLEYLVWVLETYLEELRDSGGEFAEGQRYAFVECLEIIKTNSAPANTDNTPAANASSATANANAASDANTTANANGTSRSHDTADAYEICLEIEKRFLP